MTLTPGNPMRVVLLSILFFEVIVFGLAIPVMILISGVSAGAGGRFRRRGRPARAGRGRTDAPSARLLLGWVTQPVGVALGLLTVPMFVVGVDVPRPLGARLRAGQAAGQPAPRVSEPPPRRAGGLSPGSFGRAASAFTPSVRSKAVPRSPSASRDGFSAEPAIRRPGRPGRRSSGGRRTSPPTGRTSPKNRSSSPRPSSGPADMCTPLKFELTLASPKAAGSAQQGAPDRAGAPPWLGSVAPIRSLRSTSQSVPLLPCRNAQTVSSAVKKPSCRGWKPFRMTTGWPSTVTAPAYVPGPSRPTWRWRTASPARTGRTRGYRSGTGARPAPAASPERVGVLLRRGPARPPRSAPAGPAGRSG